MKTYIENFKKYRFLLWELVKKRCQVKVPAVLSGNPLDSSGTAAHNDCSEYCIWNSVWK